MRFVIAIVLFVGAFLSIGFGIAQRTVLAGPDQLQVTGDVGSEAPLTLISGETLNAVDGQQRITVESEGPIVAVYGRTSDVMAWIGDAGYNDVAMDETATALTADTVEGSEASIPALLGSDLWLAEQQGEGTLSMRLNAPDDVSVLLASGDVAEEGASTPAPGELTLRWPLDNSTPWSGPLILGGIIALLFGLIAFLWALLHARRRRGPRRTAPRMPRPPKPPRLTARNGRQPAAVTSGPARSRRRIARFAPIALVPALALAGCTADGSVPDFLGDGGGTTPTPTATAVEEGEAAETIAVTQRQFTKIMEDVAATVATADEELDAELLETRMSGPALELRTAAYRIRDEDADRGALPAIPGGQVEVLLPQQNDSWPRTVYAVVSDPDDEAVAPQALMLVQADPRAPYKIDYAIQLEPNTTLPDVASADAGAPRLPTDLKLLAMPPDQLATAYGDILAKGDKSERIDQFEAEGDSLRVEVGAKYKAERKRRLPDSAQIAFATKVGEGETIAFGTLDSGAVVAVNLNEVETVKPKETGAAINPTGDVKVLSGKSSTTKGISATYGYQLLFYVPNVTAEDQKVVLLGYSQGLIAAKESR